MLTLRMSPEESGPPVREAKEVLPGIWSLKPAGLVVGNLVFVMTDDGVAVIDPGAPDSGPAGVKALRERTGKPVRYIIYTHGHGDHAFGTGAYLRDARERGFAPPEVAGHENINKRLQRYQKLQGQHSHINRIQFQVPANYRAFPEEFFPATLTYHDRIALKLGDLTLHCRFGMGETDDCTWVWIPERKIVMAGDFVLRQFPNPGNPFKVQRYVLEWAEALEQMAALEPEWVIPGHGDVLDAATAQEELLGTAKALRYLEDEVVRRLNDGQWHEQILEEVDLPPDLKSKPYLNPSYGCPRFAVHSIIRRYSGWHDGNPGNLFPATRAEIASDVIAATGGAAPLLARARALRNEGGLRNLQRALHMADFVLFGEGESGPNAKEAHALKSELLTKRAEVESSFIARNIFIEGARREKLASES